MTKKKTVTTKRPPQVIVYFPDREFYKMLEADARRFGVSKTYLAGVALRSGYDKVSSAFYQVVKADAEKKRQP